MHFFIFRCRTGSQHVDVNSKLSGYILELCLTARNDNSRFRLPSMQTSIRNSKNDVYTYEIVIPGIRPRRATRAREKTESASHHLFASGLEQEGLRSIAQRPGAYREPNKNEFSKKCIFSFFDGPFALGILM